MPYFGKRRARVRHISRRTSEIICHKDIRIVDRLYVRRTPSVMMLRGTGGKPMRRYSACELATCGQALSGVQC